ncbi:MAG: serine/threonine protein kinase, partial [bacterium]
MFRKGEKIGQYKLVKKLGSGTFGEVWLADREGGLGTSQVAIKLLREAQNLDNLKREVEVWVKACSPRHDNVLLIFEADIIDEQPFIASEYASGGSLDDWLKVNNGIAPSMEKAIYLTIGILKGLEHLHSKDIVHRDIKPQNILFLSQPSVGQDEVVKLADFGIAKVLGNSHTTGMLGTPAYIAPETLSPEEKVQAKRYSPQSDIWAVGIVLYQLVSGRLPFPQPTPAVLLAILNNDVPVLPDNVPNILKEVVAKCLERDLGKRYQSAREMIEALQYCRLRLNKDDNQLGPYHLIRELGKGAFGRVFLAERRGKFATTKVAVKVLLGQQDHEAIAKEAQV